MKSRKNCTTPGSTSFKKKTTRIRLIEPNILAYMHRHVKTFRKGRGKLRPQRHFFGTYYRTLNKNVLQKIWMKRHSCSGNEISSILHHKGGRGSVWSVPMYSYVAIYIRGENCKCTDRDTRYERIMCFDFLKTISRCFIWA